MVLAEQLSQGIETHRWHAERTWVEKFPGIMTIMSIARLDGGIAESRWEMLAASSCSWKESVIWSAFTLSFYHGTKTRRTVGTTRSLWRGKPAEWRKPAHHNSHTKRSPPVGQEQPGCDRQRCSMINRQLHVTCSSDSLDDFRVDMECKCNALNEAGTWTTCSVDTLTAQFE